MEYLLKSDEAQVCVKQEGAMLTSLEKNGIQYLWQGDDEHWAGQAPICFPIVGVLPDDKGTAFGKECHMKRHGIARINPFDVKEKCTNSITFIQHSSEKTKKSYPFDYALEIKYTLVNSSINVMYTVKNTGTEKMPFTIGGHPAFNCPLEQNECFEDYKVIFDKPISKDVLRPDHRTGLVNIDRRYPAARGKYFIDMKHSLFEENDAMIFDDIVSKKATLIGKNGKGIKIEFQDMANLLVWSACNNADFVALEPWSGVANCSDETDEIEKKRGVTILNPDCEAVFSYKITMI